MEFERSRRFIKNTAKFCLYLGLAGTSSFSLVNPPLTFANEGESDKPYVDPLDDQPIFYSNSSRIVVICLESGIPATIIFDGNRKQTTVNGNPVQYGENNAVVSGITRTGEAILLAAGSRVNGILIIDWKITDEHRKNGQLQTISPSTGIHFIPDRIVQHFRSDVQWLTLENAQRVLPNACFVPPRWNIH